MPQELCEIEKTLCRAVNDIATGTSVFKVARELVKDLPSEEELVQLPDHIKSWYTITRETVLNNSRLPQASNLLPAIPDQSQPVIVDFPTDPSLDVDGELLSSEKDNIDASVVGGEALFCRISSRDSVQLSRTRAGHW